MIPFIDSQPNQPSHWVFFPPSVQSKFQRAPLEPSYKVNKTSTFLLSPSSEFAVIVLKGRTQKSLRKPSHAATATMNPLKKSHQNFGVPSNGGVHLYLKKTRYQVIHLLSFQHHRLAGCSPGWNCHEWRAAKCPALPWEIHVPERKPATPSYIEGREFNLLWGPVVALSNVPWSTVSIYNGHPNTNLTTIHSWSENEPTLVNWWPSPMVVYEATLDHGTFASTWWQRMDTSALQKSANWFRHWVAENVGPRKLLGQRN